jgi:uncharacterized membrane protein YukC
MATMENGRLEGKIDRLADEVQEVKVLVASMMPRAEVDAEIGRRVSVETYTSDQRATNERLIRLESSPTRLLAWVSGGVGCLGVALSVAMLLFYVTTFVLIHYKP